MSFEDVALQITLKAMELKLIPSVSAPDREESVKEQARLINQFFSDICKGVQKAEKSS